jgi:DNA helicase-2/ATP-dependent DNA helicase PcrA
MSEFIDSLELNPPQKEAVLHTEGPILVLAGAGTGKTRVLTSRIAYIINSGKAKANEVLAVTFTNKAAKEMQHRISMLLKDYSFVNAGTFHSISAKILRKYSELIGLTPYFSIIDQDDQIKIIKSIFDEQGIDKKETNPKNILSIIQRWKDLGIRYNQVSSSDIKSHDHFIAKNTYEIYQNKLISSNLCDFGDLLLHCTTIFFEHPDILNSIQNQYKYILIDEYQDTNAVQYLWARMIAQKNKNICCVGDDDQSIYSWRGAEIANILRFEKDFTDAKIIALEQNYRSTPYILNAASALITNNPNRHKKTLWTSHNTGEKIRIISCYNEKEEARFISNMVLNNIANSALKLNDIAVLVRAGFQTRPFEEAFIASNINYKIIGGLKFYERSEIKDAIAYLRLLINKKDDVAFERIINNPKRSIGPTTLLSIKNYAASYNLSLYESIIKMQLDASFKGKLQEQIKLFIKLIEDYTNLISKIHIPSDVLKNLLLESGYKNMLKIEKTEESKSRLDNLNELIRAVEEYDSIFDFIQHVSLVMDNDENIDSLNSLNLMTIHASKGLEFDTVFIPGMEEGLFPHQKSITEEGEKGIEEERRIAYVAITRAKKSLIILHAETRRVFNEFIKSIPSRFLSEIPAQSIVKSSSTSSMQNTKLYKEFYDDKKSFTSEVKSEPYRPGARVLHDKFGAGIILKKNSDNLEIYFENSGIKTIKQNFICLIK